MQTVSPTQPNRYLSRLTVIELITVELIGVKGRGLHLVQP